MRIEAVFTFRENYYTFYVTHLVTNLGTNTRTNTINLKTHFEDVQSLKVIGCTRTVVAVNTKTILLGTERIPSQSPPSFIENLLLSWLYLTHVILQVLLPLSRFLRRDNFVFAILWVISNRLYSKITIHQTKMTMKKQQ